MDIFIQPIIHPLSTAFCSIIDRVGSLCHAPAHAPMRSGGYDCAVGQTGRAFVSIGFSHADRPAPRRLVSGVCRHAATACPASIVIIYLPQ